MAIYQGNTKVSGNARVSSDLPLFFPAYLPNHPNNASWLWADPFSWHSAAVYVAGYNHLVNVVNGVSAQTETIAGISITYYRGNDGLKIVLADQLSAVNAIYNATGIGFYFILDTTNQQFKLPRNIYGFTGHRGAVGNYVEESLPNIRGYVRMHKGEFEDATGAFSRGSSYNIYAANGGGSQPREINFAASSSSATYKDGAAVQQRATQAYLYFYVGNTVQDATTVAVGQITEALNSKADQDLQNITNTGKQIIVNNIIPNYGNYIEVTQSPGVYTQVTKDSFVVIWASDPYMANNYIYVSPDNGTTTYRVGWWYNDINANTKGSSWSFLVPKGWYFTSQLENSYTARIYPLQGAQ